MKKMNKKQQLNHNLISVFVIFTILFTGAFAISCNSTFAANVPPQNTVSTASPTEKTLSTDSIPEKNATELKHFGQKGMQNGLIKFGLGMLGVLISAAIIFFGLKLYQKFIMKKVSAPDSFGQKNSLDSPKDMKEAINLFLDKTDN